ncbi:MAG: TRZ/ATZ family hydrolase [Woeseiaceae bacterium]|nr:TRZ/ATZ family hydrolase [Woeseiaceae bacterium]
MEHCDLIIAPRWLVAVDAGDRVLENAAVAINDGRIIDVLSREEADEKYQASATIERPDHALIPGLINAHTHAAMTLFRGMADDLPLEAWLYDGIWPAEKRWVSSEMVRDGTELAIAEMLSGGTTCFSDQYFFPEIAAATASSMNIRAVIATPVVDFETNWAKDANEHMQKAADLVHDAYIDHPLVSSAYAPHSPYALSDESLVSIRVMADQLDLRVQMHLHETRTEVENSVRQHGKRPIARLQELGLVNSSLLAVHAVHLNEEEIGVLADVGAAVAHCPKSNMKLASGFAPVGRYRDVGISVGIGTDGAASNNVLDMFSEMRSAALVAKGLSEDAQALPAKTALRMATAEAAASLGLESELGSIEPGKWADIACVDLNRRHSQPVYDPVSQLVYTARADQVSDVWVAGKQVVASGSLTDVDEEQIHARCNEWQQRIAQG